MKLLNSFWNMGVNTWTRSSDIISVQPSAFLQFHTQSCFQSMKPVCVCWPDSKHVWTCQDSVYLCSRDLPDALGCGRDTPSPNQGVLSTSQKERGWEAGFCPQVTRGSCGGSLGLAAVLGSPGTKPPEEGWQNSR